MLCFSRIAGLFTASGWGATQSAKAVDGLNGEDSIRLSLRPDRWQITEPYSRQVLLSPLAPGFESW